jgi:hypothetical protein
MEWKKSFNLKTKLMASEKHKYDDNGEVIN